MSIEISYLKVVLEPIVSHKRTKCGRRSIWFEIHSRGIEGLH